MSGIGPQVGNPFVNVLHPQPGLLPPLAAFLLARHLPLCSRKQLLQSIKGSWILKRCAVTQDCKGLHAHIETCNWFVLMIDFANFSFHCERSIPFRSCLTDTDSTHEFAVDPDTLVHLEPTQPRNTHAVAIHGNGIWLEMK